MCLYGGVHGESAAQLGQESATSTSRPARPMNCCMGVPRRNCKNLRNIHNVYSYHTPTGKNWSTGTEQPVAYRCQDNIAAVRLDATIVLGSRRFIYRRSCSYYLLPWPKSDALATVPATRSKVCLSLANYNICTMVRVVSITILVSAK